ncbi:MAG: CoA pyrophosphatase [Solirubrobacterales bacterium]
MTGGGRGRLIDCIAGKLLTTTESLAMSAQGRDAAVLIPLVVQPDESIKVVFTKRRDDLPTHAGQISFPGGRAESDDADLVATALRESFEELEIPTGAVDVIGAVEPMSALISDHAVYPVVGLVPAELKLVPHPGEVDTVFDVDLHALHAMREKREIRRAGLTFTTEAFETDGGLVWGVTGRILGRLLDRIEPCLTR